MEAPGFSGAILVSEGDEVVLHKNYGLANREACRPCTPGSRLAAYGPWTIFAYAKFANWNQYRNLVWNSEDSYRSNYSGPWPTFFLIPTGKNQYTGVLHRSPWNRVELYFQDECLVIEKKRACPGEP